MLKQIRQNVSKSDIVAALSAIVGSAKPRIDVDPPTPMPFQITDFRVVLGDEGLNASDARRLVECRWTVNEDYVEGKDFSIYYFFEPRKLLRSGFTSRAARSTFQVKAEVFNGSTWIEVGKQTVTLAPDRDYVRSSTLLSVLSFSITVVVVTIGLLAVAQEKLQTLDVFSGSIALLTLGFGADVIKRSLTKT